MRKQSQDSSGKEPRRIGNWRNWLLVSFGFILLAIVAVRLLHPPEPVYAGRTVSDHLVDLVRPPGSGSYLAASNAIVQLGVAALPVIEAAAESSEPILVRFFLQWRDKLPDPVESRMTRFIDPHWYKNRGLGAFHALELLGTNSFPVAPLVLHGLMGPGTYRSERSVRILQRQGPAIMPLLDPWLEGTNLTNRHVALVVLRGLEGRTIGQHEEQIVARQIRALAGADQACRLIVEGALASGGQPSRLAALKLLKNEDPELRRVALWVVIRATWRTPEDALLIEAALKDVNPQVQVVAALALVTGDRRLQPGNGFPFVHEKSELFRRLLRQGLAPDMGELRIQAAIVLVGLGESDDELVAAVEEMIRGAEVFTPDGHRLKDLRHTLAIRRGEDASPWDTATFFRPLIIMPGNSTNRPSPILR